MYFHTWGYSILIITLSVRISSPPFYRLWRWCSDGLNHTYTGLAVQDSNSVCLTLQPVILTTILHLIIDLLEMHCYRKKTKKLTYLTSCMCLQATYSYYTHTHTHTHTHKHMHNKHSLWNTREVFFHYKQLQEKKRENNKLPYFLIITNIRQY